jgi:predicted enzyme related to lactoylglutathione lyase
VLVKAPDARWSVDFWVDDANGAVARAEAGGGSVIAPLTDTPVGRTAMLADPSGASFTVSRVQGP